MNWTKLRNPGLIFWVYGVLILCGSSIPSASMPKLGILTFDKVIHFTEYSIFGILFLRYYRRKSPSNKWLVFLLIPLLFPLLDESWQRLIPGRDSSIFDAMADWLGIAFGYGLGYFISRHDRTYFRT